MNSDPAVGEGVFLLRPPAGAGCIFFGGGGEYFLHLGGLRDREGAWVKCPVML